MWWVIIIKSIRSGSSPKGIINAGLQLSPENKAGTALGSTGGNEMHQNPKILQEQMCQRVTSSWEIECRYENPEQLLQEGREEALE